MACANTAILEGPWIERHELSTLAARFKRVMSERGLNELGRGVRFCRRERLLTPFRLAVSLVGSFALRQVETIADLQRAFNAKRAHPERDRRTGRLQLGLDPVFGAP
jgi:hypothetical protein